VANADVTLVDTNVLLDLVTDDPDWSAWSLARLEEVALAGPILINDVIYAETSIRYSRIEDLDAMLAEAKIELAPIPRSALFLAGKVFQQYRRAGGIRSGVLPDFFIGAHAAVEGWPLLTRDTGRYRGYFPTLTLIDPHGR
jgi:predicted nucleic acid-binding protein